MTHTIYLVRHGEQEYAEHGVEDGALSARGLRQAELIADRLSGVRFTSASYSPLKRADETMRAMTRRMPALSAASSTLLLDCVPTGMLYDMPDVYAPFFGSYTDADFEAGAAQMGDAVSEYLSGPREPESHELLVTHNSVIAWLVREILDAPEWRWVSINQANCALTVLQRKRGRPWSLLTHNDMGHLPMELRTGLPEPFLI
jgi:serine/threonine-protein phosphatase PGAM5